MSDVFRWKFIYVGDPIVAQIKGYGILDWQYFHVEAWHDIASRQAAPDNNVFVSCWWGLGQQLDVLLKPPLFPGCEWKCIIIRVNNRKNRKKKKKLLYQSRVQTAQTHTASCAPFEGVASCPLIFYPPYQYQWEEDCVAMLTFSLWTSGPSGVDVHCSRVTVTVSACEEVSGSLRRTSELDSVE